MGIPSGTRYDQYRHASDDRVKAASAISADTKKKELVVDFREAGREYRPRG